MSQDCVYGYPCVTNPNDFTPDPECCSPEEMETHRKACANWGKPAYEPNKGCYSEHSEDGQMVRHVLRTSWGIGTNLLTKCDDCGSMDTVIGIGSDYMPNDIRAGSANRVEISASQTASTVNDVQSESASMSRNGMQSDELIEKLQGYLQHKPDCPQSLPRIKLDLGPGWTQGPSFVKPCTCGLAALLRALPQTPEPTVDRFVRWVKATPHSFPDGSPSEIAYDAQVRVLEQLQTYLSGSDEYLKAMVEEKNER